MAKLSLKFGMVRRKHHYSPPANSYSRMKRTVRSHETSNAGSLIERRGRDRIRSPSGHCIAILAVVGSTVTIPTTTPQRVFRIDHRRTLGGVDVAVGVEDVHLEVMAIGGPLAVSGTIVSGIEIGIERDQAGNLLSFDIGEHDHLAGLQHISILYRSLIPTAIDIAAQAKLGVVSDIQAPIVVAQGEAGSGGDSKRIPLPGGFALSAQGFVDIGVPPGIRRRRGARKGGAVIPHEA